MRRVEYQYNDSRTYHRVKHCIYGYKRVKLCCRFIDFNSSQHNLGIDNPKKLSFINVTTEIAHNWHKHSTKTLYTITITRGADQKFYH